MYFNNFRIVRNQNKLTHSNVISSRRIPTSNCTRAVTSARPSSIDPSSFQRELCWNRRDAVPFPENDIYPPLPNTLTIKTNLRDFRIYINYFVYLLLKGLQKVTNNL